MAVEALRASMTSDRWYFTISTSYPTINWLDDLRGMGGKRIQYVPTASITGEPICYGIAEFSEPVSSKDLVETFSPWTRWRRTPSQVYHGTLGLRPITQFLTEDQDTSESDITDSDVASDQEDQEEDTDQDDSTTDS